jgi:hypothetical protein
MLRAIGAPMVPTPINPILLMKSVPYQRLPAIAAMTPLIYVSAIIHHVKGSHNVL